MASKVRIELTKPQLEAILSIAEEFQAMIGEAQDDSERVKWIKLAKRAFDSNNINHLLR